jgi:hypothetical protein
MRQTADYAAMQLVARTALPPDGLAAGIRTALRPSIPVCQCVTSRYFRIWSTKRFHLAAFWRCSEADLQPLHWFWLH